MKRWQNFREAIKSMSDRAWQRTNTEEHSDYALGKANALYEVLEMVDAVLEDIRREQESPEARRDHKQDIAKRIMEKRAELSAAGDQRKLDETLGALRELVAMQSKLNE
jgi:hypothetical protein